METESGIGGQGKKSGVRRVGSAGSRFATLTQREGRVVVGCVAVGFVEGSGNKKAFELVARGQGDYRGVQELAREHISTTRRISIPDESK